MLSPSRPFSLPSLHSLLPSLPSLLSPPHHVSVARSPSPFSLYTLTLSHTLICSLSLPLFLYREKGKLASWLVTYTNKWKGGYCCFFSRIWQVLSCKIFLYNVLTVYLPLSLALSILLSMPSSVSLILFLSFSHSLSFSDSPPLSPFSLSLSHSLALSLSPLSLSLSVSPSPPLSLPRSPSLSLSFSFSLSCALFSRTLSLSRSFSLSLSLSLSLLIGTCACASARVCLFSYLPRMLWNTKWIEYKVCVFVFIGMYVCVCVCAHMCTCVCVNMYVLYMKYIHIIFVYTCIHASSYILITICHVYLCVYIHTRVYAGVRVRLIYIHINIHILSLYTCFFISSTSLYFKCILQYIRALMPRPRILVCFRIYHNLLRIPKQSNSN